MRSLSREKMQKIQKFVDENPSLEFKLTKHVFDRLRDRMGWSREVATSQIPNRTIVINLSEGIVEIAKGEAWKIHLFGWGKFVVLFDDDNKEWLAVTFYPERY